MTAVAAREAFALSNQSAELAGLDGWFTEVSARLGVPAETAEELRVALHEVIGNIIMHGCPPGVRCRIAVSAEVVGPEVILTVEDDARPFDPLQVATAPLGQSLEDAAIGGLGLHLVRSFTDRLAYDFRNGCNRLVLARAMSRP